MGPLRPAHSRRSRAEPRIRRWMGCTLPVPTGRIPQPVASGNRLRSCALRRAHTRRNPRVIWKVLGFLNKALSMRASPTRFVCKPLEKLFRPKTIGQPTDGAQVPQSNLGEESQPIHNIALDSAVSVPFGGRNTCADGREFGDLRDDHHELNLYEIVSAHFSRNQSSEILYSIVCPLLLL
jgi:hypothetical protein